MFYRDWRFSTALVCTILQQALLALSTYHIAKAGAELSSGNIDTIVKHVTLFFIYALSAFTSSSASSMLSIRASNSAWNRYSHSLLFNSTSSMELASESNKRSVAHWLSGEASSTIAYACNFYIGVVSVALNIILSLLVFYISTGWEISLAIGLSLSISVLLVGFLRAIIEKTSGDIQAKKLKALLTLETTWNLAIFGNNSMRKQGFSNLERKNRAYFKEVNQYTALEQIIACTPIIISTTALVGVIHYTPVFTLALAGTFVALLPRTLQLLGNVHTVSIYMSQYYLIRTKLQNLKTFHERLNRHAQLFHTSFDGLLITSTGSLNPVPANELLEKIANGEVQKGRFTITGLNGAGKSSFLKIIKSQNNQSILLSPETIFTETPGDLSTGQEKLKDLEAVMTISPAILMLDEWDANLDQGNFTRLDTAIEKLSNSSVIIEVRHSRETPKTSGFISEPNCS